MSEWNLFYSGCELTIRAITGVGLPVYERIAGKMIEWISISIKVGILKLEFDSNVLNSMQSMHQKDNQKMFFIS